jgi:dephospho-CoA kinase
MIVIGLTGGIGSGKSEVSRVLNELGAEIIDADRLGHEAYQPHTKTWEALVAAFGEGILRPGGEVDRKALGLIVFSSLDALAQLNAIVHPRMREMMRERLGEHSAQGIKVVVIEAAVLLEAGWDSLVDEVWVTTAIEESVVQRLSQRNNLSEEEIRKRINSQLKNEERVRRATVVIKNSDGLKELRQRVLVLWDDRIKGRVS